MLKVVKNEQGQAMVEYALVLPVFLLLLMFVIDVGWITYQKVMFNHVCRRTSWDISLPQEEEWVMTNNRPIVRSGFRANRILREQFSKANEDTTNHIDLSNVSISNGKVSIYPGSKVYKYNAPRGVPSDQADVHFGTTTIEIQGVIEYTIEPLTPLSKPFFRDGINLTNNLYKARRIRMQS
ncbi:TadE/TadG family type IV pilus assembly protein [Proteinivorax tanatarense]|uniref:TadE/TadG family type IV pilus assembly protein n=1 Tax=Proteinivorax tanatarense TaxID=1260629 RepID=A0AAU7VJY7_9FIRM